MSKKKTVGQESVELSNKKDTLDSSVTAVDLQREMQKGFEAQMRDVIRKSLKKYQSDFFIVVISKRERLLKNIVRSFFLDRRSCPSPEYDQAVYRYLFSTDQLEFIWVVPAKDVCEQLRDAPLDAPAEERELLNYVFDFYDGKLLKLAKKYNGEEDLSKN